MPTIGELLVILLIKAASSKELLILSYVSSLTGVNKVEVSGTKLTSNKEPSISVPTIKEKGSSTTTGTNKGTADVSNHLTFYIQPQKEIRDGLKVFGTLGFVRADVESRVQSISSTDKTVDQDLDGTKLGLGLKKETGFGFVKLEYSETDYDDISATTSNSTKVTADIDTEILALSVAKSF